MKSQNFELPMILANLQQNNTIFRKTNYNIGPSFN
ncbi:unnamed protein product [Paramecium sonneborni]|uniref:Uncharacterized protein n=1 Tax=Paramecium sonneborni TaxID=65129 RepID=A0A8S1QC37_9CILI|nr:unnamed protein product [Paramecium sonneborni]